MSTQAAAEFEDSLDQLEDIIVLMADELRTLHADIVHGGGSGESVAMLINDFDAGYAQYEKARALAVKP